MEELSLNPKQLKYCSDFYTKTIRHLLECKSDRRVLADTERFKDFLIKIFGLKQNEVLFKYMIIKHLEITEGIDEYLLGLD